MAKSLLFSFDDLTDKNKVVQSVKKQFESLNLPVSSVDVPQRIKRTAGISYREVSMTFVDSQIVTLRIKKTGDIFEVRLNGKAIPIRNQDDQKKGLKEIAEAVIKNQSAFQRKLARIAVKVPTKGMRSTVSVVEQQASKIDELKAAIAEYQKKTEELRVQRDADKAEADRKESALLTLENKANELQVEIDTLKKAAA